MNNLSKTLVLCSALMLTACAEDDPQQFIQEGQALFEKGEFKSARVQFKNALQINPQLASAYYGLALLDEKSKDLKAMGLNLLETVRLDPKNLKAQVRLGFLQLGKIDKAKERLEIALKLDSENINAMLLDGRIRSLEKDNEGALVQVDRVLVKDPVNAEAIWLKASISLSEKHYDDALALLNRGLEAHPESLSLGMLKINLYKQQELYDEVNRTYKELLAQHPEDKTLRYARLEILARTEKADEVEKALRDAIAKDQEDMALKMALVEMLERSDTDKAEEQLKKFTQARPDDISLKGRLAGFYIGNEKYSQAEGVLQEIIDKDSVGKDGLMAKVRLAEINLIQNNKEKGEMLLDEVLVVDNANSNALLLRSGLRIKAKNLDGAVSDLRIVLRDKPDSDEAMVKMGQAYMLKGEQEVAESHWRKALESNPTNMEAIMPLVVARMGRGDSERAADLLVKAIKLNTSNPILTEMLVKVRASKKDWAAAQAAIDELDKQPQNHIAAQMLSGMLLDNQGLYRKAISIYKTVLLEQPNTENALLAIVRSYKAANLSEELVGFLKLFLVKNPSNIQGHNLLGQVYVTERKWVLASEILKQALELNQKSAPTYRLLGFVLLKQGNPVDAVSIYKQGLNIMPDNPVLMMALAKHFKEVKAYDKAIESYEALLKEYPDADEAANNLADILVSTSDDPNKLRRATELVARFKESKQPYALDTYGWVLFKAGELDKAVIALKKSAAAVPGNADIRYHLGEILYAVGDYSASKVELEKSLSLVEGGGEFAGIERARFLLKEISASAGS